MINRDNTIIKLMDKLSSKITILSQIFVIIAVTIKACQINSFKKINKALTFKILI